jgi:hypothetical protein
MEFEREAAALRRVAEELHQQRWSNAPEVSAAG